MGELVFAEVFKTKLGSIRNGADPMVEWVFVFSGMSECSREGYIFTPLEVFVFNKSEQAFTSR